MSAPSRAKTEPKRAPSPNTHQASGEYEAQPSIEDQTLERHAALLSDPRLSSPGTQAQRLRLLQRLQHGYGNGHVARLVQRVADCPAPPAETPKIQPADDPKFKAVEAKVHDVAKNEKKHPPAKAHANEAEAAAQPPGNDVASQAAASQVDAMSRQPPGTFDKKAFIAAVKKAIEAASPKTLEEADDYKKSGKAGQVKDQVSGLVTKNKDESQKAIKDKTEAPPDSSSATPKPITPMREEKPGPPPGDVGASKAIPDAKTPAETSLASGPCEVNSQMADAGVTEEQLKKSNEPQFGDALDQKKKAEVQSEQAPKDFKADEKQVLGQAATDAKSGADKHLDTMHLAKGAAHGKVGSDKGNTKAQDEAKRNEVAAKLESIYSTTRTDVTAILDGLDGKVNGAFESGEKGAREAFENYVQKRMDAYKDKRYSGLEGAALWIKDKVMGMPEEVNAFYAEGRNLYLQQMDAVIDKVADIVGSELTRAKQRIAQGRQQIQEAIKDLSGSVKDLLKDTIQKINGQFDQLESDVNSKQDSLVQDLAQKYVAAREAIDARINELKSENKGLVDAAKDAINGVIDTIKHLKDMLLGVLAKAGAVIDKIIADPIKFLGNLVSAIKQGLNQFVGNIATHLKKGLMGWLFGALGEAGITMPDSFDLKGIISLVLQVLGLTYDNIRGIAVKIAGEKVVSAIEKTVKFFITLATEGPAGLWNFIKEKIAEINIKEMVLGAIKDFVITKIITAGITWLIGLLNPAAAFIKACKMIYDVIMFFIERGAQIMEFVNSVLDGIGAIADGAIGSAANLVENSLAKILPLAISFLASLLGIGGIAEKIKEIIEKIRAPITKLITAVIGPILKPLKKLYEKGEKFVKGVIDKGKALGKKALDKVKGKAKGLLGGDKADERTPAQKQADLDAAMAQGEGHLKNPSLSPAKVRALLPAIKKQFKMKTLELVVDSHSEEKEIVHLHGEINPSANKAPVEKLLKKIAWPTYDWGWHKTKGGHMQERHTSPAGGSALKYLVDRSINQRPGLVSSAWTNESTASRTVFPLLESNKSNIVRWLIDTETPTLTLQHRGTPSAPIGYGIIEDYGPERFPLWHATVVLKRLGEPTSFFVLTAYPVDEL